jgi:hypothetical protein
MIYLALTIYTVLDFLKQLSSRVFASITIVWALIIVFSSRLPHTDVSVSVAHLGLLVYFVVASADVFLIRLRKGYVELFLSRPFSRAGFILASFFGTVLGVLLLTSFWGIAWQASWYYRTGNAAPFVVSTCLSVGTSFTAMYAFILVGAIMVRSSSFILLPSIIYVIFGAAILEARKFNFLEIGDKGPTSTLLTVLYYMTPQLFGIHRYFKAVTVGIPAEIFPITHAVLISVAVLIIGIYVFERQDL